MAINLERIYLKVENFVAFSDLNMEIPDDPLVTITGANGIGKTLILMMIHGLIEPQMGRINYDDSAMRDKQAFVFQKPIILNRSVDKNMELACKDKLFCQELLNRFNLWDKHNVDAGRLSGGEQQRLSIARALSMRPKLLIMDEPTTYLDAESMKILTKEIIIAKEQGLKMLMVSHDTKFVKKVSDRTIEVPVRKEIIIV